MRLTRVLPRFAAIGIAVLFAAPSSAQAAPDDKEFDETEGFDDPRKRDLPRTHRLRLALASNYIRLSSASDDNGNSQRFHYSPLMLDLGYQAQFARYLMLRIAVAFGGNVANSRNAMPLVVLPKAYFGYQGKMLGLAATYGYMVPFPKNADTNDGRDSSLVQPLIGNGHVIGGEASFSSRVDRVALTFGIGAAAVRTTLDHYDLGGKRWYPMLTLSIGAYFDGSIRRSKGKSRREENKRVDFASR